MNTKSALGFLAGLALWAGFAGAAPFAYIPLADEKRVMVVALDSNAVVAFVPVGADPIGVAINGFGNRVYVTNANDNTVSVIDATNNTVLRTIAVGVEPFRVATNPQGTKVAVATLGNGFNTISIIDTNSSAVSTITVGFAPVGVVFSPTGSPLFIS